MCPQGPNDGRDRALRGAGTVTAMAEPTDDRDAEVDQGPVVDHLVPGPVRRERSRGVGHRLLLWAGCLSLLLGGLTIFTTLPQTEQQGRAMLAARTCTSAEIAAGDTAGCFVEVSGRIDARFSRGEWRFVPDDGARRPGYVRFFGDGFDRAKWPPDLARVLGGEHTTALYWGREPVAFVVDGRRVETSSFGTSLVVAGLWGGVCCLSLGLGVLHLLLGRPAGRLRFVLLASGLAALACIGVDVVLRLTPRAEATVEVTVWVLAVVAAVLAPRRWVSGWRRTTE